MFPPRKIQGFRCKWNGDQKLTRKKWRKRFKQWRRQKKNHYANLSRGWEGPMLEPHWIRGNWEFFCCSFDCCYCFCCSCICVTFLAAVVSIIMIIILSVTILSLFLFIVILVITLSFVVLTQELMQRKGLSIRLSTLPLTPVRPSA